MQIKQATDGCHRSLGDLMFVAIVNLFPALTGVKAGEYLGNSASPRFQNALRGKEEVSPFSKFTFALDKSVVLDFL